MMGNKFLKKTVLLVDDDADLIDIYVDYMKFLGFEHIITASNGEDAVTKYKTHLPDLVLMGENMQKMNGITAFNVIKNLNKDVDVIFLTSDTHNLTLIDLEKDHTVEIISKTVSPPLLITTIQKHIVQSSRCS